MDPITAILITLIFVGLGIAFWHKILEWGENNLFPWFEKHLPTLVPLVRLAFSSLDNVAVGVRHNIKAAWNEIKKYLLKQVVEFERDTSSAYTWIIKVTSWVIKALDDSSSPVVEEIRTEQKASWDDLPEDVRKSLIKLGKSSEVDVTETREKTIELVN